MHLISTGKLIYCCYNESKVHESDRGLIKVGLNQKLQSAFKHQYQYLSKTGKSGIKISSFANYWTEALLSDMSPKYKWSCSRSVEILTCGLIMCCLQGRNAQSAARSEILHSINKFRFGRRLALSIKMSATWLILALLWRSTMEGPLFKIWASCYEKSH